MGISPSPSPTPRESCCINVRNNFTLGNHKRRWPRCSPCRVAPNTKKIARRFCFVKLRGIATNSIQFCTLLQSFAYDLQVSACLSNNAVIHHIISSWFTPFRCVGAGSKSIVSHWPSLSPPWVTCWVRHPANNLQLDFGVFRLGLAVSFAADGLIHWSVFRLAHQSESNYLVGTSVLQTSKQTYWGSISGDARYSPCIGDRFRSIKMLWVWLKNPCLDLSTLGKAPNGRPGGSSSRVDPW